MSTKIYDGVVLENVVSAQQLLQFRQDARAALMPVFREESCKQFYRCLVAAALHLAEAPTVFRLEFSYLDFDGIREAGTSNLWRLRLLVGDNLREQARKNAIARTLSEFEPSADFKLGLAVFPLGTKTLAYPLADNGALLKAFNALPGVREYGYWDNTDKPEDVTDMEWSQRYKDWEEALPGIGILREHGLCFDILGWQDLELSDFILSDETKQVLRQQVISDSIRLWRLDEPGVTDAEAEDLAKRLDAAVQDILTDKES